MYARYRRRLPLCSVARCLSRAQENRGDGSVQSLLEDRLERTMGPQTGWEEGRQVVLGLDGALGPHDCRKKRRMGLAKAVLPYCIRGVSA